MIFLIRGKLMPYTRTVRGQFRVDENAAKYKNQEAALKMLFQAAMRDAGEYEFPGQTPLEVVITIHKSPLHKCDLDNLVKALLDAGNRVIYPDDRWIDYIRAGRTLADHDQYTIFEIRRVDQVVQPCETMEVLL